MRLFVGGLNYNTTQESLRDFFEEEFSVSDVIIMNDRVTGKSKGFGFVDIVTDKSEQQVIEMYQNAQIDGRDVTINRAHPKPTRDNGGHGRRVDSHADSRGDREYVSRRR